MARATAFGIAAAPEAGAPASGIGPRVALILLTCAAVSGAVALGGGAEAVELDLARVIRCMAAIKGGLALLAFAACLWRLSRPSPGWRGAVYVAGPPLMAAGAIALWNLASFGLAALGLHAALGALLAAALTDRDFILLSRRASSAASLPSARSPRSGRA